MEEKTTYVYRGTEVILTGRKASRKIASSSRRHGSPTIDDVLYEIVPADPKNGTWSSWIKIEELFIIHHNDANQGTAI